MKKVAAGIDIGGTNTVFAWVDESGIIQWRSSVSTADFTSANALVTEVCKQLKAQLFGEAIGIGVGAPSANFYSGCIEHAPNLNWGEIVPLQQYFEAEMGLKSIVTNDANAAAIGEQVYGIAQGMKDFMMVTLGTGLGSGFVANGELIYGHDGFAGELGHTIIEPNGRPCGCGRNGCLETYASATGMQKTALELSGEEHSSKAVAEAAEQGKKWALDAFEYTAEKLGIALANSVAITRPEAIVLFGGLAQAGDLLLVPTKKYMEENLLHNYQGKIPLLLSALSQSDAAVLGASALVWKSQL